MNRDPGRVGALSEMNAWSSGLPTYGARVISPERRLSETEGRIKPTTRVLADRIQTVPRLLTAEDLIPLVASLPDTERVRLLRWIASPHGLEDSCYRDAPATDDEFSGDDEPLAWEA